MSITATATAPTATCTCLIDEPCPVCVEEWNVWNARRDLDARDDLCEHDEDPWTCRRCDAHREESWPWPWSEADEKASQVIADLRADAHGY